MRILTAALLAAALAACSGSPTIAGAEIDRTAGAAQCSQPAALTGAPDPRTAGKYIVVFRDGTDAAGTTQRLAQKYGFQPRHVYEHALQGFSAPLADAQLAGVRCEAEVKYVSHDGWVSIGG
jgi:Peptidase inhibitor I9